MSVYSGNSPVYEQELFGLIACMCETEREGKRTKEGERVGEEIKREREMRGRSGKDKEEGRGSGRGGDGDTNNNGCCLSGCSVVRLPADATVTAVTRLLAPTEALKAP